MLSWAPSPVNSTLDRVSAGVHDAYITDWARALQGYGREVWLRLMWEDNGNWYWWSSNSATDPNARAKYQAAFQHVVDIMRREGASNVRFVWSPMVRGASLPAAILSYPGAGYVDRVGLDGYPLRSGAGDFAAVFKRDYDDLVTLGKPLLVAETAINVTPDANRAAYVTSLLGTVLPTQFPSFTALVWFNEPTWGNLVDPNYPLTQAAFAQGIASPYDAGR
jgi:beta-mannanase